MNKNFSHYIYGIGQNFRHGGKTIRWNAIYLKMHSNGMKHFFLAGMLRFNKYYTFWKSNLCCGEGDAVFIDTEKKYYRKIREFG